MIIIIFEPMRNRSTNAFLIALWIAFSLNSCFAQRDLEEMRQLIFEKTNALRVEKGLYELRINSNITNNIVGTAVKDLIKVVRK